MLKYPSIGEQVAVSHGGTFAAGDESLTGCVSSGPAANSFADADARDKIDGTVPCEGRSSFPTRGILRSRKAAGAAKPFSTAILPSTRATRGGDARCPYALSDNEGRPRSGHACARRRDNGRAASATGRNGTGRSFSAHTRS